MVPGFDIETATAIVCQSRLVTRSLIVWGALGDAMIPLMKTRAATWLSGSLQKLMVHVSGRVVPRRGCGELAFWMNRGGRRPIRNAAARLPVAWIEFLAHR